jgi:hypothetical protein
MAAASLLLNSSPRVAVCGVAPSRLAQCIPVVAKDVFQTVRTEANALLDMPHNPVLPMLRPFVDVAPGLDQGFHTTPMRKREDWALAIFLPPQNAFFVTNSGQLVFNFNHKIKDCANDGGWPVPCKLWKGTILGVERTDTDWFAADAYVIAGNSLLSLSYSQRRKELLRLKQCMPLIKFAEELEDSRGSRLWDLNSKLE